MSTIKTFYVNNAKHMIVKKLAVTHTWDMIKDAAWQSCLIVSGSASFISKEIDAHEFKSQHIKITLQWDYWNVIDIDYCYYAHGCRNVYFGQGPSHMLDRLLTLR